MDNWKSENWWVSKYNYLDEFRNSINLPEKVIIHDATLRDGEQTPGVVFSVEEKINIAKKLDEIGVERIEAGMPAVSEPDLIAIKEITKMGLKAKIFTFARAVKEDIDMALECNADGVIIEIPTGRPKLTYQFPKWSDDDIIERSVDTVKYAKENNLETVYFGYDTTRADFDFLERLYNEVIEKGNPDSIGIVDTMGCILPGAAKELLRKLKKMFPVKLEIHTHNDLGLATAVSFAAIEAGAEVIHTSVNGLGERTGNTSIEQIMVGLKILYGLDVHYKIEKIAELSEMVENYSAIKIPGKQPIIGKDIFVRESGIGIDLVLNTPLAMFALNPAFIGQKAGVVLGKKSGKKSIEVKLDELGLSASEEHIDQMLNLVKAGAIEKKRTLTVEEFKTIVDKVCKVN